MVSFFRSRRANSILDLGAGRGSYVETLRAGQLRAGCFDGNPSVRKVSERRCLQADLSETQDLGQRWRPGASNAIALWLRDWVMSIEVAEHVPLVFEQTYMDNLDRSLAGL